MASEPRAARQLMRLLKLFFELFERAAANRLQNADDDIFGQTRAMENLSSFHIGSCCSLYNINVGRRRRSRFPVMLYVLLCALLCAAAAAATTAHPHSDGWKKVSVSPPPPSF